MTEQVPQTTPEQREELARLASEATPGPWTVEPDSRPTVNARNDIGGGYFGEGHIATIAKYGPDWQGEKWSNEADAAFIAAANPATITALLSDRDALEARVAELQRDIQCETPDPCDGCEDEWGDEAGAPTCHQSCERFDAYGKTATFRMKTAEIDGRCHFEAASQLEGECQRLRERAEVIDRDVVVLIGMAARSLQGRSPGCAGCSCVAKDDNCPNMFRDSGGSWFCKLTLLRHFGLDTAEARAALGVAPEPQ